MSCQIPDFLKNTFDTLHTKFQAVRKEFDAHCHIPQPVKNALQEVTETVKAATISGAEVIAATTISTIENVLEILDTGVTAAKAIKRDIDAKIDEKLDPRIATIAKNVLSGIPVAVLLLAVPHPLPLLLTLGYATVRLIEDLAVETKDTIDAGIALRHFAKAGHAIGLSILRQNPALAVGAVVHGLLGLIWILPNQKPHAEVKAI